MPAVHANGLRVAFAGTPEFAAVALARLHAAGFHLPLVLTQPDRPAGRGMKLQASPVKQFAVEHHIPVVQPHSLRLDGKFPDDAAAAQAALQTAFGWRLRAHPNSQPWHGPGCKRPVFTCHWC